MTFGRLLLRNLCYHWRANLAVMLGVAVGAAVLTGALLVGDSLRGSLKALALRRLGWVDQSLVTGRFFRDELADKLQMAGAADRVAPVLFLQGSVSAPAGNTARKVTILGVDDRFFTSGESVWLGTWKTGDAEKPVYLNHTLAAALNVRDGDRVKLHLQREAGVPRESLLGRKDDKSIEKAPTLTVHVLPEDAAGSQFSLNPTPEAPRNAFVPLGLLQSELDLEGRVNALLVGGVQTDLDKALRKELTLADWDVKVVQPLRRKDGKPPGYLSVESRRLVLEPAIEPAVRAAKLTMAPTVIYMVNDLAAVRHKVAAVGMLLAPAPITLPRPALTYYGPLQTPYAVVAAIDLGSQGTVENELRRQGVEQLKDGAIPDIVLVGAVAKPQAGERVALTYFHPGDAGHLEERTVVFNVVANVKLDGPLDDRNVTPQVRGITDKLPEQWDAPFPLDRTRLRASDSAYWNQHGAAPRAYVSLETGQRLWRNRFGNLTAIRVVPPTGVNPIGQVEKALLAQLDPEAGGFVFDDVKANALEASRGGTDFGMLFLGFSFFLIAAALLLVGLLFRLSLDRRASEVGILLASGLRRGRVRALLLAEGCAVAAVGGVFGVAAAIGYGDVLLGRLRAWWPGGLDASVLQLHVNPMSLAIGYFSALIVSALTIAWSVRVLGKATPRALIQGQTTDEMTPTAVSRPRWSIRVCTASIVGAVVCLVAGFFVKGHEAQAGTFFGSGMLLLIAALAGLSAWLRGNRGQTVAGQGAGAVARLGMRNAARHPARSLLTAGLLASAAFLLVGVESFRRTAGKDYLDKRSGSGGFALLAESDLPVFLDLNGDKARIEMLQKLENRLTSPRFDGDPPPQISRQEVTARLATAEALLKELTFYSFRVHGGDDASCLNLYQPRRPRVLGVPDVLIAEGGFDFAGLCEKTDNPWTLLQAEEDPIPVFGEKNTVTWMLKSGLGEVLEVPDWQGKTRDLRIDGLLQDSVFQSSLLMSERNFLQLYPHQEGFSFFLIRAPAGREKDVKELLEQVLADRGFEVTPTVERLEAFLAVENMYLSTFQALGGMGLLLGTLGLAVVLLRSVWERRAELALLRAMGYRRRTLGWLVLAENGFLLLAGVLLGAVAALAAVAPHLLGLGGSVAWGRLLLMLVLALAAGLIASTAATAATVRAALVPALRRE